MRRTRDMPVAWRNAVGAIALTAATMAALPLARWGDSALVLIIVPAAIAAYWAGRWMSSLALAVACFSAALIAVVPVAYLLPGGSPFADAVVSVPIAFFMATLPWWVGRYRLLRADQRARDRAVVAERAQADERARIADDLHDTLGHELALIAVQAGALELDPGLDAERRERFGELRQTAVRASARLREVVDLTRRVDASARLDPAGLGLESLVGRTREAGMPVLLRRHGDATLPLSPTIHDTVLRIVREGLTNAARHSPGAHVDVVVDHRPEGIDVRVVNTAPPRQADAVPGSGHGIPSLRERAVLVGGTLHAEPLPDGGFELAAWLPRTWSPPPLERAAEPAFASNARTTRRRILQTTMAPIVIAAGILVAFIALQAVTFIETAIPRSLFESVEIGQSRADFAHRLPNGVPTPPPIVSEPVRPEGSRCEYYAAREGWLHFTDAYYRLCFDGDELVEKRLLVPS